MSRADAFKKLVSNRKHESEPVIDEAVIEEAVLASPDLPPIAPEQKKRGRPATGKRSDESWIGRTYYVRRETDLDVEGELFQLKRQGIEVDKSELVDFLLTAWVKIRKGENSEIPNGGIPPMRKDD